MVIIMFCVGFSLYLTNIVVRLALVVLIKTAKCHSMKAIRKLVKRKVYYLEDLGRQHTWGYAARSQVEKESKSAGPGVLLFRF